MERNDFEVISIIASRKTEFYLRMRDRFLASLPPHVDRKDARSRLRLAVSELDNSFFISDEEKASKTIKPGLSVSQLKLNEQAILDGLTEAMTGA